MCKQNYYLAAFVFTQICIPFPFALGVKPCLTWDVHHNRNIRFVCRVPHFNVPVTFKDNSGIAFAYCTFLNHIKSCQPTDVRVNFTTHTIEIYVKRNNIFDFEGVWTCRFGSKDLTTNISISQGIISSTMLRLDINNTDADTVQLKCWSCREPFGNNAEFLINGRSEDSITYKSLSGECIHQNVPCEPGVCECASSGNEFFRSFKWNPRRNDTYSCDMIFADTLTSAKFSMIARIEFNGTGFTQKEIRTITLHHGVKEVTEMTSYHTGYIKTTVQNDLSNATDNDDSETNQTGHPVQWIIIGVLLILVILLIVSLLRTKYLKRFKEKTPFTVAVTNKTDAMPLLESPSTDMEVKYNPEANPYLEKNPTLMTIKDISMETDTEISEAENKPTLSTTHDNLAKTKAEDTERDIPTVIHDVKTGEVKRKQHGPDTQQNRQRRIFCHSHGYVENTHTCKDMIAGCQERKKSTFIFETKSVTAMIRTHVEPGKNNLSKTM